MRREWLKKKKKLFEQGYVKIGTGEIRVKFKFWRYLSEYSNFNRSIYCAGVLWPIFHMYKVFQKTIFGWLEIPEIAFLKKKFVLCCQFSLELILFYPYYVIIYLLLQMLLYNLIILKNFLLSFPLNNERIVF